MEETDLWLIGDNLLVLLTPIDVFLIKLKGTPLEMFNLTTSLKMEKELVPVGSTATAFNNIIKNEINL